MPINANFAVKNQGSGAENQPFTGGPLLLGESVVQTATPATGFVCTGSPSDFRAGAMHPASVLGTGMNPDLVVWGPEAG